MATRSYRQHCGLACALDVLGERWTLLVLRELALGPRRYRDLELGLSGIGTNLLAERLRSLESAGVIRRATLPPPAGVTVYELTERGERLRPVIEELALWGFDLLPARPGDDAAVRAAWAALTMSAELARAGTAGLEGTYAFAVGDERFAVEVAGDDVRVHDGASPAAADAGVSADPETFFAVATGALTPRAAARSVRIAVTGDTRRMLALLGAFRLPAAQ